MLNVFAIAVFIFKQQKGVESLYKNAFLLFLEHNSYLNAP